MCAEWNNNVNQDVSETDKKTKPTAGNCHDSAVHSLPSLHMTIKVSQMV